jgi:UDPglucose 6-dehydrogenase
LRALGAGYVGLVAGICLAEIGHAVICLDNDGSKIDMLHKGGIPRCEPCFKDPAKKYRDAGRPLF